MHTQTHRHFVAVPLTVLFLCAIAGLQSIVPAGAAMLAADTAVFRAEDTSLDVHAGWILSGTLEPEAVMRIDRSGGHPQLLHGHALIRSAGLTDLRIGPTSVRAFAASYVAMRDGASSTVAALTAPVIVESGGGVAVVVPGMQVTIDATGTMHAATVPHDWYRERLQAAKLLPDVVRDTETLQAELLDVFDGSRITRTTFSQMEDIVHRLDPLPPTMQLIYIRLYQEHQRTDDDVSVLLAENIANDSFLAGQLVFGLPILVRTLMKPIASPHIQAWERSALLFALSDPDAAALFFRRFAHFPHILLRAGYPQQSLLWQRAFLSVGGMLRTTLPEELHTNLDGDLAIVAGRGTSVSEAPAVPSVSYVPTTEWTSSQLLQYVRTELMVRGVLLSAAAELVPDTERQAVRVSGVFMAEHGTDIPYAFVFDVPRGIITDIIRDGTKLPNAVPIALFFH